MPQNATNKLPPEMVQALSEQLRDVHLPEAISWWPLAWGWWALLAIILCIVITVVWFIRKSIVNNRYRGFANTELELAFAQWKDDSKNNDYLQSANAILKRIILHTSNNPSLATVSGSAWAKLLNGYSVKPLSETTQNALAHECYKADSQTDIKSVHVELVNWLKKHKYKTITEVSTSKERGQHA